MGPIKILVNHRLGGLANGLVIEGIGTIKWKFCTKIAVIVVTSSWYHVLNTRERLISPQRLFCEKLGVTSYFLVDEHFATLEFDNMGIIEVEYVKDNNVPTTLVKNSSSGGAEVNLAGILEESNTNLTPSQKLLIHWHGWFGHKIMAQIQTFFSYGFLPV